MGCVCCSLSSFISILLHSLERITLCTVCAMLVCCILFTILSVMVMGIGIGFHYCTVQNSVDAMAAAAKAASAVDVRRAAGVETRKDKAVRTINQAVKRGFAHRLGKRDQPDELMPSNNNTINDMLLAGNASLHDVNGTKLHQADMQGFAQRFAKRDLRPSYNGTANYQSLARNLNETSSLLETGFNATWALLKDTFSAPYRRSKRHLPDQLNKITSNFTNYNVTLEIDEKVKANTTDKILSHEKKLFDASGSLNNTIRDAMVLRQNCTLLNFFSIFF